MTFTSAPARRPRVVILGGGFAGYEAANALAKYSDRLDVVLVNSTDYFLYVPLLPEIAAGLLPPRHLCVSLRRWGRRVKLHLGRADSIDVKAHTVAVVGPEGERTELAYDRLIITVGSVTRVLPIPGVAESGHGLRNVAEALFLSDHITHQVSMAAATDDPQEREARLTFVVVGAGYTGTEMAAQGVLFTDRLTESIPALANAKAKWLLVDIAERVMPELDRRLSHTADTVLRRRGVEILTKTSVDEAEHGAVTLTGGRRVPTHSLIWCVGVKPDPLVSAIDLDVDRGRLVVDAHMRIPNYPDVFACGDCAAVPDLTKPGNVTGMTAQHATRQGKRAGLNVAASLGFGTMHEYKHRNLGFLVDLGGVDAAANPLNIPMSGPLAKLVTRGYHWLALPHNKRRLLGEWIINLFGAPPGVQLGLIRSEDVSLKPADHPHATAAAGQPEPEDSR
jgi:NADH:ubiquinone reductase (H+-translocating)